MLRRRVRLRDDSGQLLLLVLLYAVVGLVLVTVVVDTSTVFLAQRALSSAADGAALAAAQQVDDRRFYGEGAGDLLPVAQTRAEAAVARYVASGDLADRFAGFQVAGVDLDGDTVVVTFRSAVALPLVHTVTGSAPGGSYRLTVRSRARAPLR